MLSFSKFQFFKSFKDDQSGNVSLMFALSFTAVGFLVGAAMDYTIVSSKSQKLQDALDGATLYSAKLQGSDTFSDSFEADARKQMLDQIGDLNLANLNISFEVQGSNIVGTARGKANLSFAGLLNKDSLYVSVRSVVTIPTAAGPCIILLDPNRNSALNLNSGAQVDASACEVHVHSTANPAVAVNSGAKLETKRVCIAGGLRVNSGGEIENEETQCTPADDPYAGKIPVADDSSCDFNGTNYNGGNVQLTPGVYCGWYAFQGNGMNVEMDPGLYVLKNGGWSFNSGSIKGEGVTIYFSQNSNINFNSGIDVELSAPSSGDYTNILMAETPTQNKTDLNLNDSYGYDFQGVIHLPNRNLTLNSGANIASAGLTIIANTLTVNQVKLSSESFSGGGDSTGEIYISQ